MHRSGGSDVRSSKNTRIFGKSTANARNGGSKMSPGPAPGRARPPGAPHRKALPHSVPWGVRPQPGIFFITVCCKPRLKNQLCTPQVALELFDSIEFRNRKGIWYVHLVVLMPDHLHALASFPPDGSMREIIADL